MRYSDTDKERMLGYPILSLLAVNGKRTDRRGPLHFSPFRDEKVGSFKIDTWRNVWYDHGEGCGGSVFTLAQRLKDDLNNRPGITKSFADRHCFNLIPSAYDMFEGGKENEVQVSVMRTREIPKAGTLDAVVLKLKNGVPLDEPRYFLSSSKLIKWLESEEGSNGRSQTKATEIAVIKCPWFSRKDYESHILRAIGSIPDWHGMDLDCLTYWIRHAALPQKKKLDSGSAANLIRWMLTEVIDCCPKGRSARTAEALRKEFEEMVKIDRSASGVSDTWHREAADWIFRANQAVEESGMDMDRFREMLRNMTPRARG